MIAALEQTAALVEGKVTPRLSTLLDGIKDEKKASLAVADPKLGMPGVLINDYVRADPMQLLPSTSCRSCL